MQIKIATALAATMLLAACGGGGSASSGGGSTTPFVPSGGGPTSSNPGISPTSANAVAISAANSAGDAVALFTNAERAQGDVSQAQAVARRGASAVHTSAISNNGTCTGGVEFFAPAPNYSANSTETKYFYDSACTQIARDLVRNFTNAGPSTEEVASTELQYNQVFSGTAAVVATQVRTKDYQSSSFNSEGYPSLSKGYYYTESGFLNVGNYKTIISDQEFSMSASSSNSNTFCSDSAGYNAAAVGSGTVFGWAGADASGTRTLNADGSVTWTSTHIGDGYNGAVGSLGINAGAAHTVCPFSTPEFSLTGGKLVGEHNIPVSATYLNGLLTNLTITNATLGSNGAETLNVQTNPTVPGGSGSQQFITGTITTGGPNGKGGGPLTQIATFNTDAFGDGQLVVTATGDPYIITSWHVRIVKS